MSFTISTDSCSDLHLSFSKKHNIQAIPLEYIIEGIPHFDSLEEITNNKEFFDSMRQGKFPTTSMINTQRHIEFFEELLENSNELLHISLSSGVSGTADSAMLAGKEVLANNPSKKIYIVDSLCGSLGESLLIFKAVDLQNQGKTSEETFDILQELRLNIHHIFTVDTLSYLEKSGRVSKTIAVLGKMLDIKPILNLDSCGKITLKDKIRKRSRSFQKMVEIMMKNIDLTQNSELYICHGDCLSDAERLRDLALDATGIKICNISNLGAVIGSHGGPGAIGLFFIGKKR